MTGCVVNGPGGAREADLGVAVEALIEEVMKIAAQRENDGIPSGVPDVTVS